MAKICFLVVVVLMVTGAALGRRGGHRGPHRNGAGESSSEEGLAASNGASSSTLAPPPSRAPLEVNQGETVHLRGDHNGTETHEHRERRQSPQETAPEGERSEEAPHHDRHPPGFNGTGIMNHEHHNFNASQQQRQERSVPDERPLQPPTGFNASHVPGPNVNHTHTFNRPERAVNVNLENTKESVKAIANDTLGVVPSLKSN